MLLVAAATVVAMLGELAGYFRNFQEQWLLAGAGSIILLCDLWVMLEGLSVLRGAALEPATRQPA